MSKAVSSRKKRLTITLSSETLRKVDQTIDRKIIRNRSHAIERIIGEHLTFKIRHVVILAGGNKSNKILSPLISIDGRPLVLVMLNFLETHKVTSFIICAGSREKAIKESLKSFPHEIHFVSETQNLGTAGAVKKAGKFLGDEPFFVLHGDVLTNINITDFISFHEQEGRLATIAVKPRMGEKNYGQVLLSGNQITDFIDDSDNRGISIINTGVYLFNPEVLGLIPERGSCSLEREIFPKLAEMKELSAFIFQGIWYDISQKKTRQEAINRWIKQK